MSRHMPQPVDEFLLMGTTREPFAKPRKEPHRLRKRLLHAVMQADCLSSLRERERWSLRDDGGR